MKDLRNKGRGKEKGGFGSKQRELFMSLNDKINRKKYLKKIIIYISFVLLSYIIILRPDLIAKYVSYWINLFIENWNM